MAQMYTMRGLAEATRWHSSEVDWCEGNYVTCRNIAEFYNTLSNLPLLLIPATIITMSGEYLRRVSWDLALVFTIVIGVGFASAYFHATLSLAGQLLDEISILWVVAAGFALWVPLDYYPKFCGQSRESVKRYMTVVAVLASLLGFVKPTLNAFCLLSLTPVVFWVIIGESKRCGPGAEWYMIRRSVTLFLFGVTCWLIDKFACNGIVRNQFPYFHAIWHVVVALATCPLLVLMALFKARSTYPDYKLQLGFWPGWTGELGVPYIALSLPPENNNILTVVVK